MYGFQSMAASQSDQVAILPALLAKGGGRPRDIGSVGCDAEPARSVPRERKGRDATKALWCYLQQQLGLEPAAQRALVDRVCTAVDAVAGDLLQHIRHTQGFEPVGLRVLWEQNEGMKRLRERRSVAMPDWVESAEAAGLPKPAPAEKFAVTRLGESPLMAPRPRKRRARPAS